MFPDVLQDSVFAKGVKQVNVTGVPHGISLQSYYSDSRILPGFPNRLPMFPNLSKHTARSAVSNKLIVTVYRLEIKFWVEALGYGIVYPLI